MLHAQWSERSEVKTITVNGARVCFTIDGDGEPTLILLHGFAAHRHWWDRIVPLLATSARIVRIDFSGNGDSEHRDAYSIDTWADEVVAVAGAGAVSGPISFIGHSLGGRVALAAAARERSLASAVTVIDTAFPERGWTSPTTGWKAVRRIYESREAAIDRFRLLPDQPLDDELRRDLAAYSVRKIDEGWTWKHDYRLNPSGFGFPSSLELRIPLAVVYGENSSVVDAGMAERMAAQISANSTVTVVPGAHHHLVLDHPDALARILRSLPQLGISQG